MLDLETGKVKDFVKFDVGNLCMVTGGHNNGRVGTIVHKEKHKVGCQLLGMAMVMAFSINPGCFSSERKRDSAAAVSISQYQPLLLKHTDDPQS